MGPPSPTTFSQEHCPPTISTTGMTMREIIDLLPPAYKQAVENVSLSHDDGLQLAQILIAGNTISAWHGKKWRGAHAYTLRTWNDYQQECLEDSSMTPGDPKSICSLRTEHYGAFGISLIVQIICIGHSITASTGYINFYIDNDTVIKRLKYSVRPEMGSTKHCKINYDIWIETLHILNCLCTSILSHVKGHQDDALYAFCKVGSPLP